MLVALALVGPVALSPASADEFRTLNYHFTADGPVTILNQWTCWFPTTCRYAACHMTTIQKPMLGTLAPRVGPSHIVSVGSVCHGQPISALSIRYTPRPGMHGQDDVVLRSIADNGGRPLLYIHIDVP